MSQHSIWTESLSVQHSQNLRCVATYVVLPECKRPKLPYGIHWVSHSPNIWFSWRDASRKQHHVCTKTADPLEALFFKINFLRDLKREREDAEWLGPGLDRSPLEEVAKRYFSWKAANTSEATVEREQRMFRKVLQFFDGSRPVRCISLLSIRQYQEWRRRQISPTMRQPITARTVNYEMYLLRGVMDYADCWTADLGARYKPLRQPARSAGKVASRDQLVKMFATARLNKYWQVAMYCAATAIGTGCRSCELRSLRIRDVHLEEGRISIRGEVAKNRREHEPRLMALAEWGLKNLLKRARSLGATEPDHYLLPLEVRRSKALCKKSGQRWDMNQPMQTWVKSWRKLMAACGMKGFRFHDLRHTFRTLGAEVGVPLEVMMAQLGHMDRETSLDYVHVQQRALNRIKRLIEPQQAEILAIVEGKPSQPKEKSRFRV